MEWSVILAALGLILAAVVFVYSRLDRWRDARARRAGDNHTVQSTEGLAEASPGEQPWTTQDRQVDQKWLDAALKHADLDPAYTYRWSKSDKVSGRTDYEGYEIVYQEDAGERIRWRLVHGRSESVLIRKPQDK